MASSGCGRRCLSALTNLSGVKICGSALIRGTRSLSFPSLERLGVAVGAAVTAFIDPARADMVALLGEVTGAPALQLLHNKMSADPDGQYLLKHKPRVRKDAISVGSLRQLPADTFGAAYARYLDAHGFDPDKRHQVAMIGDPELAYVMQRYREVHDFWHVLADLPPTVLGELAIKWLEMVQTGLPMPALSSFVAPLRLPPDQLFTFYTVYVPWASDCGGRAKFLLSVRYEGLFSLPIDEVRQRLHFSKAPQLDRRSSSDV